MLNVHVQLSVVGSTSHEYTEKQDKNRTAGFDTFTATVETMFALINEAETPGHCKHDAFQIWHEYANSAGEHGNRSLLQDTNPHKWPPFGGKGTLN